MFVVWRSLVRELSVMCRHVSVGSEVWKSSFSVTRPFGEVNFPPERTLVTKAHRCSDILEEHAAVQLYLNS
jgi:hypothetical protein